MSTQPAAWRFVDGVRRDLLVLCDHASNRVPDALGDLGLSEAQLQRHIAWDPGAAAVAERLARRLDCPAFFGTWSRLVVDLNRAPGSCDLIPEQSDGVAISGNSALGAEARRQRIESYHTPYHAAIIDHLHAVELAGVAPKLIAVHSFTPVFAGFQRPWHAGIVWQVPMPAHATLLQSLADDGHLIGDNQPYDGAAMGYTLEHLGVAAQRPHLMFELRQDLVADDQGQEAWAQRLHRALLAIGYVAD